MRTPFHGIIEPKFSSIFLPLLGAIIYWLSAYAVLPDAVLFNENVAPVSAFLNQFLEMHTPLTHILGFVYALILGLLLVQMNETFSFIRERTLLPFFFFILTIGANAHMHEFDFRIVGVLFLILSLFQLFTMYMVRNAVSQSFNIGLFLSIGSIFSFGLLFFIPFFIIAFIRMKTLYLKTFIAYLIGIVAPYIIFVSFVYLYGDLNVLIEFVSNIKFTISFVEYDFITSLYFSVLSLVTVIAMINLMRRSFSENIKGARVLGVFSIGFVYSALLFLSGFHSPAVFMSGIVFSSVVLAHYFTLHINMFIKIAFGTLIGISFVFFISSVFFSS